MSETVIDKLKEENLCTHFILPLIKLNKFSFISSNFVNCYINREKTLLFVQVLDLALIPRKSTDLHPAFFNVFKSDTIVIVFRLPNMWNQDVQLFIEGKYSKMSEPAKECIRKYSGLAYKRKQRNKPRTTDLRLLALERHTLLKNMWEKELTNITGTQRSVVVLPDDAELLSIPGEETFMELSDLKKNPA